MQLDTKNPLQIAELLSEHWSPKVISEIDESYVKVAKIKGSFVWHQHDDQDELFYILKGSLVIQYKDKNITLNQGDLHVVPKGVLHNPVAEHECLILLIENKQTLHTGQTVETKSRSIAEQLDTYHV